MGGSRPDRATGPERALPSPQRFNQQGVSAGTAHLAERAAGVTAATTSATVRASAAPAAGGRPAYVTPEQGRATVDAVRTTRGRLLLECLWQSGGRVPKLLPLASPGLELERITGRIPDAVLL